MPRVCSRLPWGQRGWGAEPIGKACPSAQTIPPVLPSPGTKLIVESITSGPWGDQPLLVIYTNITLGIPCGTNTTISNYTGPYRLILLDVSAMGLERNDRLLLCTFDNGVEVRGTVAAEEWGDGSVLAVLQVDKGGIVSRYSTVSRGRSEIGGLPHGRLRFQAFGPPLLLDIPVPPLLPYVPVPRVVPEVAVQPPYGSCSLRHCSMRWNTTAHTTLGAAMAHQQRNTWLTP